MTLQQVKDMGRQRHRTYGQFYSREVVYKITNLINGKVYIGLTSKLQKRLKSHLYHATYGSGQLALHRALRKYGLAQMSFEVLEIADAESLSDRERHWIAHFRSNEHDHGYNLNDGGYNPTPSDRTIQRMRVAAKNKVPVHLYDRDGQFIQSYESINACARALNTRHCTIWKSIKDGALIKRAFIATNHKTDRIKPHDDLAKGKAISRKMRGNRNGTEFEWTVIDSLTGKTYQADSLLCLAEIGGYTYSPLSSLAYGRSSVYKGRLKISRTHKSQ